MDFQKWAKVVWILGIVVLLYGWFQVISNGQRESPSGNVMRPNYGGRSGEFDRIERENARRSEKQEEAKMIMIAGGIVAAAGLLMKNNFLNNKK
jgi:hypothetical protein